MSTLNEKRYKRLECVLRVDVGYRNVRTNTRQIVIVNIEGCAKTIQYTFFFKDKTHRANNQNPSFTTSLGRHTHTFSKKRDLTSR